MKPRHSFPVIPLVALAAILLLFPLSRTAHAAMTDYCQVPPYVIQNIPPNVLILLDISGSMLNFAYSDGYQTPTNLADDRSCTSTDRCTQYNWTGRPATHRYYGYFDPNNWYTYASNVFTAAGSMDNTAKPASGWSGDFLNWLTMRRIDIMRKVLTGGRPASDKIWGEIPDYAVRGLYKEITTAEATANTPYNQAVYFVFDTGNSGTSNFDVKRVSNDTNLATKIQVNVQVPLPVEGVLQTVVGARARVGLEFYHVNDGGNLITYVGKTVGGQSSLTDTINQINLSRPSTNTPLGESLWTSVGYFAQSNSISGYNTPADHGPNYANDYVMNTNLDPMNFGTGGAPRWPLCQKNFVLLLTDGEPCSDGNLPNTLLDYAAGKSDFNCQVQSCPSVTGTTAAGTTYTFTSSNLRNTLCSGTGNATTNGDEAGVEDVALFMHTKDLRSYPTIGLDNITGFQNLTLYTVFAFGKGSTLLRYAAINGGFEDSNGNNLPDLPVEWDKNGDGVPDTFYEATEGEELEQAVRDAFSGILKRASSGTAASVLASGEGSGANLIQAVFYPRRRFGNDLIWWTGSLQNLWYHVDPFFANATIREETTVDSKLNLANDYIVQFFYDPVAELTNVRRWADSNGDGVADSTASTVTFESVGSLWEAGKKLWERDLSSSARNIYTNNIGGTLDTSSTMTVFSVANAATLSPYIVPDAGDNVTTIIRYVQGIDNTDDLTLRSRTATIGVDNNVWKLGDVVNSTPRIVASVPLNKYDSAYNDTTYKDFIDNTAYKNRGMVFTGGNDGMLHAFRLGKLELSWTTPTQLATEKARITNPYTGTILGDEAWAFIPKNALPYLKYLKDVDYCHLYYADLSPYVFDASINGATNALRTSDSWRTVLIGGMRTGGACANTCTTGQDCVKTPAADKGFSSYFAMDVTDPTTPSLLWEFSNPNLGFTTTGPAIVRIDGLNAVTSARDRNLNGEWYVVFGSGPTGPIDNTNNQFLGRSNQNLRFFVLNLKTGALVQTIDTGITYAFAGSMVNSVADFNLDYQDDAIYAGYVKRAGSSGSYTWTDGGVGRIVTKNTTPGSNVWAWSRVIDGIGPVTSSVARLQNKNYSTNWLFVGTGRYYYENPPTAGVVSPEIDDATGQRRLFGFREPCFTAYNTINPACTTTVAFSTSDALFPNVTDIANVPSESTANSAGFKGWYIDLDPSSTIGTTSTYYTYDGTTRPFRSERVITDPLATTSGVAFFTTYKPYADECALGGKSFLWALRYNTGGAPSAGVMKGKALVQVSTASVEQLNLADAFTEKDGRRTAAIEGVPPTAQGLSLLSQPPPVKRIMHMMER
ncbi:MAG: PilC/PilY family type IV pilus protein [Deltaproteobacteria bacterium]|nr:PilC/PilY family type IV pilus protein [Deltaproteobacteria bacterium]